MPKRNLAWILIIVMIALLMWQLPQTIAERDSVLRQFGPLVDASTQIRRRFVKSIDDGKLVRAANEAGIRAMIEDLHDPHAIYLNEEEYRTFKQRTEGRYDGIGIEVWVRDKGLEVLSREPDSPAMRAGILPGDIITRIDDMPTAGLTAGEAERLLYGPPETEIELTLVRPGATEKGPIQLRLFRSEIDLDPVRGWSRSVLGGWRFLLDPQRGIAYIRLTKFAPDVDDRLDEEVMRLQRGTLQGLILDLRDNTGGLLDSAREVADRFLDDGLLVRVSGRKTDEKRWFAKREGSYPQMPVVVLVNGETASAAEIVAGALRDHKRAVVVGERTYGKGSVQEVIELDRNAGAIKLTTAHYYLPNGECIQKTPNAQRAGTWGVEPNVKIPLSPDERIRLVEVRRAISRESIAPGESGADEEPESSGSFEEHDRGEAAKKLLDVDSQLRWALEHLQKRLKPIQPPPSSEDGMSETIS